MKSKNFLVLLAAALLLLSLAACVQSASKAPQSAASPTVGEGDFPVPGVTEDVMGQLQSFATQTAIAVSGGSPASASPTVAAQEVPLATAEAPAATVAQAAAPSNTPIVVATATPGIPNSWTLKRGEHPYCIARRFDVNPVDLLEASGLSAGSSYSVGTVLKIPQNARKFPGNRTLRDHPDTYTVSSKDTIFSIACEYGDADPYAIAAANGLSAPYDLTSGAEINIP
jgi:LysM repeat protein